MNLIKRILNHPVTRMVFKILSWIVLVSLVLLASILIYYVISSKIYEKKGKDYEPAISLYTIISPSMEPAIKVYDVVITKKVSDVSTLKEGDIITYVSSSSSGEGLTITHRIKNVIKTEEGIKFRTQGDNNPIADTSLVTSDNVLGKVVFKIPLLGRLQFLLQSKAGWLFLLLIPAMFIVLYDVIKVIRLSNLKQKVNESFKEDPSVQEIKEKNEELKVNLQKKFMGIKAVDPIMSPVVLQQDEEQLSQQLEQEKTEVLPHKNEYNEINPLPQQFESNDEVQESNDNVEEEYDPIANNPEYDKVLSNDLLSLSQKALMLMQDQIKEPMIEKVEESEDVTADEDFNINKALLDYSELIEFKKQFDINKVMTNIENMENEEEILPKIKKD